MKILATCKENNNDCYACQEGLCMILNNTTFKNLSGEKKPCPFYKKKKNKE